MTGKEEVEAGRVARIMEFLPASSSCTVVGERKEDEDAKHLSGTLLQSRVNSTENSRTADRTSTHPVFQSAIDKDTCRVSPRA